MEKSSNSSYWIIILIIILVGILAVAPFIAKKYIKYDKEERRILIRTKEGEKFNSLEKDKSICMDDSVEMKTSS